MRVTKAQFKYFEQKVWGFIDTFGLKSWELDVTFDEDDRLTQGSCTFDLQNRIACINLNTYCYSYMSKKALSRVAFHEVCELFFADFRIHMNLREDLCDQIIHEKIRTLENILYE